MAAELKKEFQVEAELVADGGGIFDVEVDGTRIFCKREEGDRFPTPGEIPQRMRA